MSTTENVEAGNEITATLPFTLAEGSPLLSTANIVGLLTDKHGQVVDEITPTVDDDAGLVSCTFTFTDAMSGGYWLRLDGDKSAGGDLFAKTKQFYVSPARVQRPAP